MTNKNFTTKDIMRYRSELYGIAIILIVIYHISDYTWATFLSEQNDIFYQYVKTFLDNFRFAVDLFLFLSPIGLFRSMQKNGTKTFYINRIKRVLIPALIIFIPYYIYIDFFARQKTFLFYLGDITTINFWIPNVSYSYWYVASILVLYALYPLFYKLEQKTKHISTYILFLLSIGITIYINLCPSPYTSQIEIILSRLPVFFLGMLLTRLFTKEYKIPWWVTLITFILWVTTLILLFNFGCSNLFRLLGSLFAVLSAVMFSFVIKKGKRFTYVLFTPIRFIGNYTLEIYILHLVCANIIARNLSWDLFGGAVWMLIILAVSLLLSLLVRLITNLITKQKIKIT